jgi:hypothetical protein
MEYKSMDEWMNGWMNEWLIDWLIDWLVGYNSRLLHLWGDIVVKELLMCLFEANEVHIIMSFSSRMQFYSQNKRRRGSSFMNSFFWKILNQMQASNKVCVLNFTYLSISLSLSSHINLKRIWQDVSVELILHSNSNLNSNQPCLYCDVEKPAISIFCSGKEPILIVFPTQEERNLWMADLTNKSFDVLVKNW